MEPVPGLARVRRHARSLAEHQRALLGGADPLLGREDEHRAGVADDVGGLRQPRGATAEQIIGRIGRAACGVRGAPRVETGKQDGDRVLERPACHPAGLLAGPQRDLVLRDLGQRGTVRVRDRDRRRAAIPVTRERRHGLRRGAARRDRDRERLGTRRHDGDGGGPLDDDGPPVDSKRCGDRQRGEP
jgi:hypothetical protein